MKNRNKIILVVVSLILICVAGGVYYGLSLMGKVSRNEISQDDEALGITPSANENEGEAKEKKPDIVNIALFGIDARNIKEASRSDSIIVLSINKENETVKITSLMRDMYVSIPGKSDNRINAAYAYGGPELAIKTINTNFGLDIRDYATVNFFGLVDLVDKLGGVDINIKSYEVSRAKVKKSGLQTLNGNQTLAYSRIRYVGNNDYERTERQRTVLNEIFKKVKKQGITKLPGAISTVLPYVETSLSNNEIFDIAMNVMNFDIENLEQYRLPVDDTYSGKTIRGMQVLVPNMEENKKLLHEFIYDEE